jgi:hypothetical protein
LSGILTRVLNQLSVPQGTGEVERKSIFTGI